MHIMETPQGTCGKVFYSVPNSITGADGTNYPGNILESWKEEELAHLNIFKVTESVPEYDHLKKIEGPSFAKKNGKWQQVWEILDLSPEEKEEKLKLARIAGARQIDQEAEKARQQFLTPGSGQALVYQAKEEEARALLAGCEAGPHLQSEAKLKKTTPQKLAQVIVSKANAWKEISAQIELVRLEAKARLEKETELKKLEEIPLGLNWPKPE